MNTYTGNFSGYVVRTSPVVEDNRKASTLPKKITHGVTQNIGHHSNTLGFKEVIKTKATLFGTLLRPKKRRKKKGTGEYDDSTLARPSPRISNANHSETLNYHDGLVVSGRLNELIRLMVPTHDYYPEQNYIFTFILCSRLFMPPYNILKTIGDTIEQSLKDSQENSHSIVKNFSQLLVEWSELFPYDFKDKLMMSQFSRCSQLCTSINPDLSSTINTITRKLVKKFQELLEYVEVANQFHIQCDEEDKLLFDVCKDPAVMAEQLTIVELEKMSKIKAEQFVEKFISQSVTCSRLDLSSAGSSTLELYVAWFNRLSYLVATEICMCPNKRQRRKLVNFFIDVGKYCLKRGNFNSLMAIIVGLNMNAVARMKKTWQKANQHGFRKIEAEMAPTGNFRRYRDILKERLITCDSKDYIIPVFSILVKDVFFLNEGIKDRLPNNLINFEKFWQLSKQIKDIVSLKNKTCHYTVDEGIQAYLRNTPVCNDEGIYKSSFEVEPPDSNFERDRYRSVRIRVGNR